MYYCCCLRCSVMTSYACDCSFDVVETAEGPTHGSASIHRLRVLNSADAILDGSSHERVPCQRNDRSCHHDCDDASCSDWCEETFHRHPWRRLCDLESCCRPWVPLVVLLLFILLVDLVLVSLPLQDATTHVYYLCLYCRSSLYCSCHVVLIFCFIYRIAASASCALRACTQK